MVRKAVAILSLWLLGCRGLVIRDRNVFLSEMAFTERLVRGGAPAVREYLVRQCTCANGAWYARGNPSDPTCRNYAEWWAVYTSRWAWHLQMARFNARIEGTRPGPTPVVPSLSCTLPPAP